MLEPGDVEQFLIDYLSGALPDAGFTVPVADRKQGTECLVLYVVGGTDRDMVVDNPTIVVDAYAARNSRASAILRRAFALIRDLPGRSLAGHQVYAVGTFRRPSSDPKPTDPVRYSCTVTIDLRMGVAA